MAPDNDPDLLFENGIWSAEERMILRRDSTQEAASRKETADPFEKLRLFPSNTARHRYQDQACSHWRSIEMQSEFYDEYQKKLGPATRPARQVLCDSTSYASPI